MFGQFQFQPYYPDLENFLQGSSRAFVEPFLSWGPQAYSFITDDFCHHRSFTGKLTATTPKSLIKIKEAVDANRKQFLQFSNQVRIWLNLPNGGIFHTKVRQNDYIKLHYEHRLRNFRGRSGSYVNFATAISASKVRKIADLRFSMSHLTQNSHYQTRIRLAVQGNAPANWTWQNRALVAHGRTLGGIATSLNAVDLVIQRYYLVLGYKLQPETVGYLRTQVEGFRSTNAKYKSITTFFDTIIANLIHKINDKSRIGLEILFSLPKKSITQAKLVYEFAFQPQKFIKASLNNNLDFALVGKLPFYGLENIATISGGLGISGITKNDTAIKPGFEINLNV